MHTALDILAVGLTGGARHASSSSKLEQAARDDPCWSTSVDGCITSESIPTSTTALEADMDRMEAVELSNSQHKS